jgi:predicted pyridoxine 5'-phosphate oxidase superfamily flavin-nucleotide-binding protein
MIPGIEVTVRVNGRVRVVEPEELEVAGLVPEVGFTDQNSTLVQGLMLTVDEAYFHCPRSFKFADLWNTDAIQANAALSLKDLA